MAPDPFALWVGVGVLACAALLSLGRATSNAFRSDWGGWDFHPYWYAGHFVRQGADPYAAFLTGARPAVPVRYLDGTTAPGEEVARGGGLVPANTAPMVLLATPFAFLTWPRAQAAWFGLNLVLVLVLPWAVLRLLPGGRRLALPLQLVVALSFYAFQGTRVALAGGQTTLVVFALMLAAALLAERRPGPAGLALGLALAKWSLALPAAVLLLYQRRWRVVALALAVQAAAFGVVSLARGTAPGQLLEAQAAIIKLHAPMAGVHLATVFPPGHQARLVAGPLLTVAVFGLLALWAWRARRAGLAGHARRVADFHVLTALVLWGLLVAYHRNYDSLVAVLFLALAVHGLARREWWRLDRPQRAAVGGTTALLVLGMVLPGEVMHRFQSEAFRPVWQTIVSQSLTITLLFMEGLTLWLLYRIKPLRRSRAAG